MLYDEAIKQLDFSFNKLDEGSKQLDQVNNAVIKAQDIITELMVTLDFDKGGDIAKNLFNLYMFFNQQLLNANINKDKEQIKRIRDMLADLRETWEQVFKKANKDNPSTGMGGVNIAG
jgi:flagellar protein FliS